MRGVTLLRNILQVGRLATPLALGSLAQAVNELADRAFLGNFSEDALAAVVPGSMMSAIFCSFLSGMIGYSGAIIARRIGADDRFSAVSALAQGVWLTTLALPLVLLAEPIGNALLALADHEPGLLRLESSYYRYALAAGAVNVLTIVLSGYLQAQKRMMLVCTALSIGSGVNILLDWLLIPSLGISGAGLGLLSAGILSCLVLLMLVLRDRDVRAVGRSAWRWDASLVGIIVRQGLPFGASAIIGAGTFTFYTLCLGKFGAGLLAAANAVFAIHGLLYFIVCAIESAVLVLVGRAYGRSDSVGMRRHLQAGAFLSVVCVISFYLLLTPVADRALARFTPSESTAFGHFAGIFLLSMVARDVFEALQRTLTGALRATGRTNAILIVHIICSLGVWLPLFTLTTHFQWPLATWQTMTLACAIHAALLTWSWRRHPAVI